MFRFALFLRVYGRAAGRVVLGCCFSAVFARTLPAQSTFGTILGTVHDASGALVTGAELTLINTGTNGARTATTDTNGDYAFRNIDVGAYQLTITATGFQTQTLPAVSTHRPRNPARRCSAQADRRNPNGCRL